MFPGDWMVSPHLVKLLRLRTSTREKTGCSLGSELVETYDSIDKPFCKDHKEVQTLALVILLGSKAWIKTKRSKRLGSKQNVPKGIYSIHKALV